MILAFQLSDLITIPFGYLLGWLYQLTSSYGLALILFAILVKLVLMPASAKGKKSTMKMSRLTPQMNLIREKYANDQQKMNMAIQELYKKEGVSMTGGCLWSLLPLLVLLPLYSVVRQPIIYMLHESMETTSAIMNTIKEAMPNLVNSGNLYYEQMLAAPLLPQFAEELKGIVSNPQTLEGLNFQFLGLDLSAAPTSAFQDFHFEWALIGLILIPLLSGFLGWLQTRITMTSNGQTTSQPGMKGMNIFMPLFNVYICFTLPASLGIYWIGSSVFSIIQEATLGRYYNKKIQAEEDEREAAREASRKLRMEEAKRQAAEQRENAKSQKKFEKKQPEKKVSTNEAGRVGERPYARGRSYVENRYEKDE